MRTIYVDVSDTIKNRLNTGIQRVVRRIAFEGMAVAGELDVEVVPVVTRRGHMAPLNAEGFKALATPRKEVGGVGKPMIEGHGRLKRWLKSVPSIYSFIRRETIERRSYRGLIGPRIVPSYDTDLFVMPNSFWVDGSSPAVARSLRRKGMPVVAIIHDVIAITHSEVYSEEVVTQFSNGIQQLINAGVIFVSVSKDAADQVQAVASARGYQGVVATFYSGFDAPSTTAPPCIGQHDEWPEGVWAEATATHLMVGTIEPRKGIMTVLTAMTLLWDQGRQDRLLIIGRLGWKIDDIVVAVQSNPHYGRRLFMIHDASDLMLADAYDRAADIIMASITEGFGLPLIEALSKGLPVVASDIAVFQELAGDVPIYFRAGDPADLARALIQMDAERDVRRDAARRFRWMDWREAARQFLRGVVGIADEQRRAGVNRR